MFQNENDLLDIFIKIAKKGFIKGVHPGIGNSGYTFEKELNKKYDNAPFPDYKGIEIKCVSRFSNYPLYLLKTTFDGPSIYETSRIAQKYGYPDKDYPNRNVITAFLNTKTYKTINNYKMKININYLEDKLYLKIESLNNKIIEEVSYISITELYNKLSIKLNKLAVVYASKKQFDGIEHFRYYKIIFYQLKDYNSFINALNNGIIKFDLISRLNKSKYRIGEYRNINLEIKIYKEDMFYLFNKVYEYNFDKKSIYQKVID